MKRFQGAGDILLSGETVAHVRYDLSTLPTTVQPSSNAMEKPGYQSVMEGIVTILTGSVDVGETYLLRIERGQVVELLVFSTISTGRLHPMYKVRVVGDPEA